jgi:hypothetical protein
LVVFLIEKVVVLAVLRHPHYSSIVEIKAMGGGERSLIAVVKSRGEKTEEKSVCVMVLERMICGLCAIKTALPFTNNTNTDVVA